MSTSREMVCLQTSLKIFRILNVFPTEGNELKPTLRFKLNFFLMICISFVMFYSAVSHCIQTITDHKYNHLELDLTYIVSLLSCYSLDIGCFVKMDSMARMLYFFSDFETFGKPYLFDKVNKLFNKLSLLHFIYLQTLIAVIIVLSNIFRGNSCEMENMMYNMTEICGLVTYTALPFDIDFFPVKQIYLIMQIFGLNYLYLLSGLLAWLVIELACQLVVRIRHVKSIFIEALEEKDHHIRKQKFYFAARYHAEILGLEDLMNNIFGVFMLNHTVITAGILGCGLFAFSHGRSIASLLICAGWSFGLFVDCMTGQFIQDESLAVGEALYNYKWYEIDDECFKRDILFVIKRSSNAMKLKAVSFGVMDRVMFLAVLKASYSYVAILKK